MKPQTFSGGGTIRVPIIAAAFLISLAVFTSASAASLEYHLRGDGNVPKGAVIFVGDSITEGMCVAAVADSSVNYGIAGDTTLGVLSRIPQYKSITRAGALVLAIGVNDLWKNQRADKDILQTFRMIFLQIPEKTPVIFSAILPIDEEHEKDRAGGNKRIIALNKETQKICAKRKNCRFVNSFDKLVGPDGNLKDENHIGDGLHISTKGYEIWGDDVKEALKEFIPDKCAK